MAEVKKDLFQEIPKICLFDFEKDDVTVLTNAGFNCDVASFGDIVKLPISLTNKEVYCRPNFVFPENLHEFDILIFDLRDRKPIEYDPRFHSDIGGAYKSSYAILCKYPQTLFDQRPISSTIISSYVREVTEKESIIIIFTSSYSNYDYQTVEFENGSESFPNDEQHSNYSFLPNLPRHKNKSGKKTIVVGGNEDTFRLLSKYNNQFSYDIIFYHPQEYKNGYPHNSDDFFPFMLNASDEIVSYGQINNKSATLAFPQIKNKGNFILELLNSILPQITPKLFPYNTTFKWLEDEEYILPNERDLLIEKEKLGQEYERSVKAIDEQIDSNKKEYSFLHDLLKASGDKLVESVQKYFHWLGFENVVNCDDEKGGLKEEDLQIENEDGLLVIEVKGIAGKSKDSECSQIDKIVHRREKERSAFDVHGLYIVNHERFLPPTSRQNPPFTNQQVEDAITEERGLITTYQLFRIFFLIESGLVSKGDVRNSLWQKGLVAFEPSNSLFIGNPGEVFYDGRVGIFNLSAEPIIRVGDEVIITSGLNWSRDKVIGIRFNDKDVSETDEGEFGLEFSGKLSTDTVVWILQK